MARRGCPFSAPGRAAILHPLRGFFFTTLLYPMNRLRSPHYVRGYRSLSPPGLAMFSDLRQGVAPETNPPRIHAMRVVGDDVSMLAEGVSGEVCRGHASRRRRRTHGKPHEFIRGVSGAERKNPRRGCPHCPWRLT